MKKKSTFERKLINSVKKKFWALWDSIEELDQNYPNHKLVTECDIDFENLKYLFAKDKDYK